jgi:hypothetical protein
MKLTVRCTHNFAEIKVDETETTIFDIPEIEGMIKNLLDVAYRLSDYTDKSITDHLNEFLTT